MESGSSFVLEDGYVFDPADFTGKIDEMTCKDTDIPKNSLLQKLR